MFCIFAAEFVLVSWNFVTVEFIAVFLVKYLPVLLSSKTATQTEPSDNDKVWILALSGWSGWGNSTQNTFGSKSDGTFCTFVSGTGIFFPSITLTQQSLTWNRYLVTSCLKAVWFLRFLKSDWNWVILFKPSLCEMSNRYQRSKTLM